MKPAIQHVVLTRTTQCLLALVVAGGMLVMAGNAHCDNGTAQPKDLSKPYIERQTYKEGQQSFYKDNNDWVYTPAFAKTFGMPPENVYPELKGIEAAAFRIEEGHKLCGMGGKEGSCMEPPRCVTDIYIDESKYPLPWATEQLADFHPFYSSVQWLEKPGERGGIPKTPKNMKPFSGMTMYSSLHPFMDAETNIKVYVGHNGNAPKSYKDDFSGVPIFGYKRGAIAGLTMISLSYSCMSRNSEHTDITFSFRSAISDEIGRSTTLKKFHEFVLPDVFERKIDARLQEKQKRDEAYYLQILNQPNKK